MGKSAFSGPVYGAKATLVSAGPFAVSGNTSAFLKIIVPAYETWYATEYFAYSGQATSNTSNASVLLKIKGTSTSATCPTNGPDPSFPAGNPQTAFSITGPTSTATWQASALPSSQTPGEYEGVAIPANSSIRFVSSGTIGQLSVVLRGFTRYLDSTRAV